MEKNKNLGIWMDHSSANLIDLQTPSGSQKIESEFDFETQQEALDTGESHMHNKRQQMHEAYYKEISEEILKYDHVLLFGPTNAKSELHNYLNKDSHFKSVTIDVESSDNMSDNEKNAFVKSHFKSQ